METLKGLPSASSISCREEKSFHIPEAETMGPTGCLSSSEIPKQVHSVVKALCGRWPAEYRPSQRSLYLMLDLFTSSMALILTQLYSLSAFLVN